jgi:hypothetical protein
MASLSYTTWWLLGYLHEDLGKQICGYGGMCLFAGFGARWRKRFFGPGQLIEPDLYEEIGRWFYRVGVLLVLCGAVIFVALPTLGSATTRRDHKHQRSTPAAPAAGTNGVPAQLGLFIYGHSRKIGLGADAVGRFPQGLDRTYD